MYTVSISTTYASLFSQTTENTKMNSQQKRFGGKKNCFFSSHLLNDFVWFLFVLLMLVYLYLFLFPFFSRRFYLFICVFIFFSVKKYSCNDFLRAGKTFVFINTVWLCVSLCSSFCIFISLVILIFWLLLLVWIDSRSITGIYYVYEQTSIAFLASYYFSFIINFCCCCWLIQWIFSLQSPVCFWRFECIWFIIHIVQSRKKIEYICTVKTILSNGNQCVSSHVWFYGSNI